MTADLLDWLDRAPLIAVLIAAVIGVCAAGALMLGIDYVCQSVALERRRQQAAKIRERIAKL